MLPFRGAAEALAGRRASPLSFAKVPAERLVDFDAEAAPLRGDTHHPFGARGRGGRRNGLLLTAVSVCRTATELKFFDLKDSLRAADGCGHFNSDRARRKDRKSTRLNSSHTVISYAVFCLKKKK